MTSPSCRHSLKAGLYSGLFFKKKNGKICLTPNNSIVSNNFCFDLNFSMGSLLNLLKLVVSKLYKGCCKTILVNAVDSVGNYIFKLLLASPSEAAAYSL